VIGLLGRKLGMTQRFDEQGQQTAVTVIQAGPCTVVRVCENAGQRRIQVGYEAVKPTKLSKAECGHLTKCGVPTPLRHLREFEVRSSESFTIGQQLTVALFEPNDFVDVTARSIGKGFQGGMKRWGWKGGGASHGSMSHRRIGSMGSNTDPGRVFRGHHLPGHMGNTQVTMQNLRVMEVHPETNLLVVKGAVPGHTQSLVLVRKAVKRTGKYTPPVAPRLAAKEKAAKKETKAPKKETKAPKQRA